MADAKTRAIAALAKQRLCVLIDEAEAVMAYAHNLDDKVGVGFTVTYTGNRKDRRYVIEFLLRASTGVPDLDTFDAAEAMSYIHKNSTGEVDPVDALFDAAMDAHEEDAELTLYHIRGINEEEGFEELVEVGSAGDANTFIAEIRERPYADYVIEVIHPPVAAMLENKGMPTFRPTRRN